MTQIWCVQMPNGELRVPSPADTQGDADDLAVWLHDPDGYRYFLYRHAGSAERTATVEKAAKAGYRVVLCRIVPETESMP